MQEYYVMHETLDTDAIRDLASREASDVYHVVYKSIKDGIDETYTGASLRRTLYEYLLQAPRKTAVYRDEQLSKITGLALRRFSGIHELPEKQDKLYCAETLTDLQKEIGISMYSLTKSTFAEPGYLRSVLRGPGVEIDQTKDQGV